MQRRLQDGDPHGVGKMVWPDGRSFAEMIPGVQGVSGLGLRV